MACPGTKAIHSHTKTKQKIKNQEGRKGKESAEKNELVSASESAKRK